MIRLAQNSDLPAIVAIYNEAIAARCTADVSPISIDAQATWLADHDPGQYPVYVACSGAEVLGWCSLSPYRKGRQALRHTAEISYYVTATARRKGIATSLVGHCFKQSSTLGLNTLFAIVLEHNTPSRRLLEKMGFVMWGFMPDVADFGDFESGHHYYGTRLEPPKTLQATGVA